MTENIDINKQSTTEEVTDEVITYESFEDLDLKENLLRGIYSCGYEKPSVIQQKAIKPFIDGGDLIAQAQSGTGKTATFSIGSLQRINPNKGTQSIIISHTRELAEQIHTVISSIGQYLKYNIMKLSGGTSVNQNMEDLRRNRPHIIIATPGRLLDMLNKRLIDYRDLQVIVIDEADELLSSGFVNQIHDIFRYFREIDVNVALFSATMPMNFLITKKIMRNPKKILVKKDQQH